LSIESIHNEIVSNVRENLHYLDVSIFIHILSGRDSGMEYDIGSKIKAARIEKKLTQEQVAELLGVSRQTISNWENEKSYPDIISVIKMSECYDVSLDYLLKGEEKMKNYYDYLEESTNVVKSNTNRNKIVTILSYLLIWAYAMIVFWFLQVEVMLWVTA